tara:strand:- start:910 stop:1077 length:168 start_codon:yes stop_codon:yes gene_type:complete
MVAPWIKKKRAAAAAPEVSKPAPVVVEAEEPAPKKAEAPKKPAKKVARRTRLSKE